MALRVTGERTRKNAGTGVRRPRRFVDGRHSLRTRHLWKWHPATSFQITLEDIGALVHQWDETDKCHTCDGTGTIQKDAPNHLYHWARVRGAHCQKCGGEGQVIRLYEERLSLGRSLVRPTQLMFVDDEGTTHLTNKHGKKRRTRCGAFKELSKELFLTAYGTPSCLVCMAWVP